MEQYYQEFERVLGEEDIHQYWAGNYFVEKENLRVIVLNTNYLVSTDNNYANEDDTTGDKIMRWLSTVSAGTKPCLLVGHHSPLWYGAIKLQYRVALQNTKCVAAWGHGHFTASRANHVMAAGTSSWYDCHIPEVVVADTCDGTNICKLERIFACVDKNGYVQRNKWEIETIHVQNTQSGVQFKEGCKSKLNRCNVEINFETDVNTSEVKRPQLLALFCSLILVKFFIG